MKLGIALSLAILLLVGGLWWGLARDVPDRPTLATAPDRLEGRKLPADLPALYVASERTALADDHYKQALGLYFELADRKPVEAFTDEEVMGLADHLIAAMEASRFTEGYFDQDVPMQVGAEPAYEEALATVPHLVLEHALTLHQQGQDEPARRMATAVFALGHRLFEQHVRLDNRWLGLQHMASALAVMAQTEPADGSGASEVAAWRASVQGVIDHWKPKMQLLRGPTPHVADLIQVARHDKDRTFRIAAVLRMSIGKFRAGTPANRQAVEDLLDEAAASDDPLIREAAEAAQAFTQEQYQRL